MLKNSAKPEVLKNYLAFIKNSIGTRIFRNSYLKLNKKTVDILENGNLSCAFFVSSLLSLLPYANLIKNPPHSTVAGTITDMENSEWKEIKKPKIGAIILWEKRKFNDDYAKSGHKHLGFYIGRNRAVSNSSKLGMPIVHHWTFGKSNSKSFRKIEKFYWNNNLV